MRSANATPDAGDFSLVCGGPLYQFYLRTGLAGPELERCYRVIAGVSLLCWLPPLLLSMAAGHFSGGAGVPFLLDVECHTRFLLGLPLLLGSEQIVHRRLREIVPQFLDRSIIEKEDRWKFEELMASAMRLRNSRLIEFILLLITVSVGYWFWDHRLRMGVSTWYAGLDGKTHWTAAGYWYAFVSVPICRFVILRWCFRLFLWYRFLWGVRRLPLHLNLFHPDRAGGLGFLANSVSAFTPILVALTIMLAGIIGNRIWHMGKTLPDFKFPMAGATLFLMLTVLVPLGFFMTPLNDARRTAQAEFGAFASRYVQQFRRKWIQDGGRETESLLGNPDVQSLADLGSSYSTVSEMGILPLNRGAILRLAVTIVLPLAPLTFTLVPLDQMIEGLVKLVL